MPSFTPVTSTSFLGPIVALNAWTFVMETWLYAERIPATQKAGFKPSSINTMTAQDFNSKIPPRVRWPADNYNHLMEQPTQFYAISLVMALLAKNSVAGGAAAVTKTDLYLAWAYVGLRVVHSLVQCLGNNIRRRFSIFIVSSAVLLGMTGRAGAAVFA